MFHVKEQANAKRMLAKHATKLGTIGDDTYYLFDGKAWRISADVVFRSECSLETDTVRLLCQTISE
jgi:hypothetical protein